MIELKNDKVHNILTHTSKTLLTTKGPASLIIINLGFKLLVSKITLFYMSILET